MTNPVNRNFFNDLHENAPISPNPLVAPQKPFNLAATDSTKKAKKDLQKKKGDASEEEDDDEKEEKPLPRPMGL